MSDTFKHGRLIAKVLAGSWRQPPLPFEISATELDIVTPMLLESGAGALLATYSNKLVRYQALMFR
jgi:hypothetical protein